uniref:glycosyltransferase family 4 protein n=1 Tax=Gelidibacter sp. TaxID=2018083 RepID=UPI00404B757C
MKIKPLKIAIYSGDIPSTTFVERLIEGLSLKGHRVILFGAIKSKPNYQANTIIAGYYPSPIAKLFYLITYTCLLSLFKYKAKTQLDRYLKSQHRNGLYDKVKYYPVLWHQPDIFHVQWAKSINEWMWVQQFGMKLVLSLRGAHINYSPIADGDLATQYRVCFPNIDGFHAVSKAIAQEALKYGAKADNVKVVYSGLDNNHSVLNIKKEPKNTVFKILSIGRNHWKKGYNNALDAVKILKDHGFDFEYTIIGGHDSEELLFQKVDLGLDKEVRLLGNVSFIEVERQIQQADLVLLSSIEEGIANVVLEAMALGTLTLSTNCGGMSEIIQHGENGFLVPIRNPNAMAQSILEIAQLTVEDIQKMTSKARMLIEKNHTSKKMVNDMEHLYQQVMN